MLRASDLIERMSADMGMLPSHLQSIIRTAPLRYKVFYIQKRSGGKREVAQPAREVKAIQRWLIREIEQKLPVHSSATAYRQASSIKQNAFRHVESNYLLKLDFQNFFPSILADDIFRHLQAHCSETYDTSAIRLLSYVCTWSRERKPPLRLCIGAPSSPLLSNSILYFFDVRLSAITDAEGVVYTRYADDLTLSCSNPGILEKYIGVVANVAEALEYPTLKLNVGKTVLASRAGRRLVTGITLTPDFSLSIGRERKRLIRAMFHRNQMGRLSPEEQQRLTGLLAFADDIEPGFSTRLSKNGV